MTMADRIVVMHDAGSSRWARRSTSTTARATASCRVHRFAAMNLIAGTLRDSGARTEVEAAGTRWPLPAQASGAPGQTIHYGIRPGDIQLAADGQGIAAKVIVVEPTGAETELMLQVGDAQVIAVIHGRAAARPGETVHLAIDVARRMFSTRHRFAAGAEWATSRVDRLLRQTRR